ncbi:uncharacterized protein LOC143106341 [Alosa pseudoharengus]|uniref:uncharacterized protein LOC143106341 n=1 Tax=Alosa pseudoharengus TaxID=34774 RepID=UPI003F8935B2
MMYSLVIFVESDETEIVPNDWLSLDKRVTFWPPYEASKCSAAAKVKEQPDEEWHELQIKWVAQYKTYEKARQKLVQFSKGKGLLSTDEESGRIRQPSSRYGPASGFDTSVALPDMASSSQLHTSTQRVKNTPTKKKSSKATVDTKSLPAIPPFKPAPTRPPTPVPAINSHCQQPVDHHSPAGPVPTPLSPVNSSRPLMPHNERELRLFQMLEEIKGQVRQNSLLLQSILRRESVTEVSSCPDFEFPLQNINDIRKMEDRLSDKETRRSLVKHLMSLGGTTTKDIIYRIMRETISNDLAKKFNWMGRGQKSPFSVLHLAKVIIDAAKKQGTTLMEAEEKIKTWLKYSGDRNGGRKRRSEKERQTHPPSHPPSDMSSDSEEISDIEQN